MLSKPKILVVEDESIVAKDLQMILERLGYRVVAMAASGSEALNLAIRHQPDLVLMDIVIKGEIDGIQTAQKIRSHINIPIIYLTAYADQKTLKRAKLTEPYGYIIKPFEDREIHAVVEMALHKYAQDAKWRESKSWFVSWLELIDDAVILTDHNKKVVFLNPISQSLTGWGEKEATGKLLKDIFKTINAQTRKEIESPVEKPFQVNAGFALDDQTVLISKDGGEIPINGSMAHIKNSSGNVTGFILIFKESPQRDAETEQDASVLGNNIIDEMIVISPQGIIETFSLEAERMFGYLGSEVIGKHFSVLIGELRLIGRRKDGTTFPMELAIAKLPLKVRSLFISFMHDLAARQRPEEEKMPGG